MQVKGDSPMGGFMRGGLGLTAFFALALWFYGCSGTEVQDPWEVSGSVEHPDGEIAVGVRVTAIRLGGGSAKRGSAADPVYIQDEVESATLTDDAGVYKFRKLPAGDYTLYFDYYDAMDPSNIQAHRVKNIHVEPEWRRTLGKATLGPASTLSAIVIDALKNEPVQGAACRIENTPYRATTGENGTLLLYALPDKYQMICEKGDLKSLPYEISLEPGGRDNPTIPMYTGGKLANIPVPANVAATLDTANGFVRVSWTIPPTSETLEFWVRRTVVLGSSPSKSWMVELGDSTFNDNLFADEPETVLLKSVQYAVYCSRKATSENGKYALTKIVNAVRGPVIESGFLDMSKSNCAAGDTAMLLGTYGSRFHINTKVIWRLPESAGKWDTLKVTDIANQSGRDTLAFPCMLPGEPSIEFLVKDATGALAVDLFKFEIISDP
jgi:hypothetical protein